MGLLFNDNSTQEPPGVPGRKIKKGHCLKIKQIEEFHEKLCVLYKFWRQGPKTGQMATLKTAKYKGDIRGHKKIAWRHL